VEGSNDQGLKSQLVGHGLSSRLVSNLRKGEGALSSSNGSRSGAASWASVAVRRGSGCSSGFEQLHVSQVVAENRHSEWG